MPDLYADYTEATASRIVRWHVDRLYAELAVWDPPASFAGTPRPVYLFCSGGARQARRDFRIGSAETSPGSGIHTVPGMMTNELGAYVVVMSTPPGGLDFVAAEEPGQEYAPDCHGSAALAAMFLRANVANPAVVGSVCTMSPLRRNWTLGGTSAGVWMQLGAQLCPPGTFSELAAAEALRGGGFRYDPDHTAGHALLSIGQNRLDTFNEYVVSDLGPSSYVAGVKAAGQTSIDVSGDTITLRRGNRLSLLTTTGYTCTGSASGSTTLAVTGSSAPIPAGCRIRVNVSGTDYEHLVAADYAGGTGSVSIVGDPLTVTVPAATAVLIRNEVAVVADYAGGTGSVSVWPALQFPLAASTEVELLHDNSEGYGEHSWAVGYTGTASMGRVWRSDDPSGRGVPLQEKLDASISPLVVASNPRTYDLNLVLSGTDGGTLQRVDQLAGDRSFWPRRNVSTPHVLPEHMNLHDCGDMAHLMHLMYTFRAARGVNVAGLAGYFGTRYANPLGTDASVPWLKGRNAAYDAQVAKTFLTDPTRFGGAFGS